LFTEPCSRRPGDFTGVTTALIFETGDANPFAPRPYHARAGSNRPGSEASLCARRAAPCPTRSASARLLARRDGRVRREFETSLPIGCRFRSRLLWTPRPTRLIRRAAPRPPDDRNCPTLLESAASASATRRRPSQNAAGISPRNSCSGSECSLTFETWLQAESLFHDSAGRADIDVVRTRQVTSQESPPRADVCRIPFVSGRSRPQPHVAQLENS